MKHINPTQIANRIGRITLATVLSGLFAVVIYMFTEAIGEPVHQYGIENTVFGIIAIWVVSVGLAGLFVAPLLIAKWGLADRLSSLRYWQAVLALAVLFSAWYPTANAHTPTTTAFLASMTTVLAYALTVVLGMALAEHLFSSPVTDRVSGTEIVTGVGAGAVVAAVLLVVAVTSGSAVGMLMEDGEDAEPEIDSDREPYPDLDEYPMEEWWVGSPDSASSLSAGTPEEPPEGVGWHLPYNVTATHVGSEYFDLREYVVNTTDGEVPVTGEYYVNFERSDGTDVPRDAVVSTGTYGASYDKVVSNDSSDKFAHADITDSAHGPVEMRYTESMWIYYDVVNEDGEVERYMAYLERENE
ncbi:hypothetical protein [Halomontanus rarus]|uniref:hypothetical protein n=1 Tax=Halomontanus rarus TaxID=3034020 RepID=UPI00307C372B